MTGVELIGGREQREVRLVPHDPSWRARFERERERARILAALGPAARRVDHIGSTAIAGLCAKPIVDIDVSVEDPGPRRHTCRLSSAGYELRVREPGHRMLRTPQRDVHVHICPFGGPWERRRVLFATGCASTPPIVRCTPRRSRRSPGARGAT